MKPVSVLLLLLLTSVHVFTPVLSSEQGQENDPKKDLTTLSGPTSQPPVNLTTPASSQQTTQPTTAAPADPPAATPPPSEPNSTTLTTTKGLSEGLKTTVTTPSSTAAADQNTSVTPTLAANQTTKENLTSSTDEPQDHEVATITKQNQGAVASAPDFKETTQLTPKGSSERKEEEKTPKKDAGAADKRLWWILLPALLVVGAIAIVFKFKSKKVHDHTETLDTGTENASFQSRPESTKDGVMLLGVKSSGGEENAAAS